MKHCHQYKPALILSSCNNFRTADSVDAHNATGLSERTPVDILSWNHTGGKRIRGWPRINWSNTMYKDLEDIEKKWEDAEEPAKDRKM